MAVTVDGALWFGMQWEGDPLQRPPLVGLAAIDLAITLLDMPSPEITDM